jgi:Cu(I)/Ag(I) efflux system periplasmic protein CusF
MLRKLLVASATLLAAACSPPTTEEPAQGDMADMDMNAPAAVGPIEGSGTVTAVDAAAGTVTLNHGPIAAIDWPAMTMRFTAEDPTMLQGVEVGDVVTFEIKSAAESQVLTALREQ